MYMGLGSFTRLARALTLCGSLAACSGASWQTVEIDPSYRPPKALTISIISRPSSEDGALALQEALASTLSHYGIAATFIPETSGTADVSLTITKWDPGSRALRWLAFNGEGDIVLNVESTAGIEGVVKGWVQGGFFGGSDENSAEAAGNLVGDTIGTGKSEPVLPPSDPRPKH